MIISFLQKLHCEPVEDFHGNQTLTPERISECLRLETECRDLRLGEKGLRKAKESNFLHHIVDKFTVTLTDLGQAEYIVLSLE
jgi:hypothetical protein